MTTLLVAISGGHLTQLTMLAPRVADEDVVWMTNDTPQSRSLLEGQTVYHVPTRPPRDYAGVMADTRIAQRALRDHRIDRVISTGAQIALSALVPASTRRLPFTYIESATRVTGISATGKVMERVPWVERYVQYPHAVNDKWRYALSVFDGFRVEPVEDPAPISRAVVTVGGNGDYGFRRLIDGARRALDAVPGDVETLWQVGSTDVSDLPIDAVDSLPSARLNAALREADVVIGHAGTGTALAALAAGKVPVLSPRSVSFGEHVDGHQHDLAAFLADRGLAVVAEPQAISPSVLDTARRWRAARAADLETVAL
ncbi:glycosyltransferase [Microbacterium hominis]|uniref:Glycosyl transferase family 28 n=1 Tax=Microbacterium hominis TaxID=162426 RepID=A0A7D4UK35_9MICO|nr:glycosyltransferase [Microbacterium hominis]QKJ20287.1 glycosyl transferase family 28 [Microbacterium hominis]